ncbi:MAG: hypothetical protein J5789_08705, partial [Oscillospiraceae bacterium]|nr:hypothetical protein [Oscillospiraceae bacterium]
MKKRIISLLLAAVMLAALLPLLPQSASAEGNAAAYRAIAERILEDGRGNGYIPNDVYTERMYHDYWGWIDEQWAFTVQCIYDYVHNNYATDDYAPMIGKETYEEISANEGLKWAYAMRMWGFGRLNEEGNFVAAAGGGKWDLVNTFPTKEDYINVTKIAYENDPEEFYSVEATGNEGVSIVDYACNKLIEKYSVIDPDPNPDPVNDTPLVVAYSAFSQKFSPFYADTACDQDVAGFVGLGLMTTDRMGGIIYNAIEGETVNYNGTDYLYTGPADL